MPRTKEFDEAEVLDRALDIFRARGYQHTSFADLTGDLGVNRQSLYDTYGDKQTLFHTALRRYTERTVDTFGRKLDTSREVRDDLRQLLNGMIDANCSNGSPGCLMVNSMVEQAPHDPDTRALAQAHAQALEDILVKRLKAAQDKGEIGPGKDVSSLAHFVMHLMLGLSVASRAFGRREDLRQTVALALQALG